MFNYKLSLASVASACLLVMVYTASALGQAQSTHPTIEYHFPMDGSTYVPSESKIIIRPSEIVDAGSALASSFAVTGSSSGLHNGTATVSDDRRTIVFTPNSPFDVGEMVNVQVLNTVKMTDGASLPSLSFSFEVSPSEPSKNEGEIPFNEPPGNLKLDAPLSLPSDFPVLNVLTNNHPAPGNLFLTTFDFDGGSVGAYRIILDSLANPIYYAKPSRFLDWDFKQLPDGRYAFCQGGYLPKSSNQMEPGSKYYIMDSNFIVSDSFDVATVNTPYTTDFHDFELLPNGHALMLGLAALPGVDMSKLVTGGNKNATIMGAVIEEIDATKNPIWIWRSWDPGHFLDTDAVNLSFLTDTIDAVHANAIQVDTDGNILLSSRHLSEITKINRFDTGSIIWRLGGKHNQFTFVNDSIHFSWQHAIRRLPNGDLTLFDNGNWNHFVATTYDTIIDSSITPPDITIDTNYNVPYARACEYDVNVDTHTATLIWHYDHDSTIASSAMGYVERLPNGNTFINWGLYAGGTGLIPHHAITEVTPNGNITFEMDVSEPYVVYRAFKFPVSSPSSGVASSGSSDSRLVLGEPFPNPSNGSSHVILSAPNLQPVQLDLYDALGREVRQYLNGPLEMPVSALEISTTDLPDGAYELVLRGGGATVSRQLVVLQ